MNKDRHIEIEIDEFTKSIEDTLSGESFETVFIRVVSMKECDKLNLGSWSFDWRTEVKKKDRDVWMLSTEQELEVAQGLISVKDNGDHFSVELVESAPHNIGRQKKYRGVPGNLFAHACRISFECGYDGFLAFIAKSKLIEHYKKSLGAVFVGGNLMTLDTSSARALVQQYFGDK